MQIRELHSHLNGLEFLQVHAPDVLCDVRSAILRVDATACRAEPVQKTGNGEVRYSPAKLLRAVNDRFVELEWTGKCGELMKGRSALQADFRNEATSAYELFARHLALYIGDMIDVGIQILPMKELQQEMSSGAVWFEGELCNLIREGRGVPAVPLVLIGVAP